MSQLRRESWCPLKETDPEKKKTARRFTASRVCWPAAVVQCKDEAGRKNRSVILSLVAVFPNVTIMFTVFLAGPIRHISGKVYHIPDINPIDAHWCICGHCHTSTTLLCSQTDDLFRTNLHISPSVHTELFEADQNTHTLAGLYCYAPASLTHVCWWHFSLWDSVMKTTKTK